MTPFTDEDLKKLKEDFYAPTFPKGCWQSHATLTALLARLEAAEKLSEVLGR